MALSCGMIAMIDDAVGRVLGELAARVGRRYDVIFTTDHGDFLGYHRLLLKGPAHYQGITHMRTHIVVQQRLRTPTELSFENCCTHGIRGLVFGSASTQRSTSRMALCFAVA